MINYSFVFDLCTSHVHKAIFNVKGDFYLHFSIPDFFGIRPGCSKDKSKQYRYSLPGIPYQNEKRSG
jgi:hypothetical protein